MPRIDGISDGIMLCGRFKFVINIIKTQLFASRPLCHISAILKRVASAAFFVFETPAKICYPLTA